MSNKSATPWWIRYLLFGIPDRATAIVFWWLIFAAAVGVPIYCLASGHIMANWRVPIALLIWFLCTANQMAYGQAIRWMDQHAAWPSAGQPSN